MFIATPWIPAGRPNLNSDRMIFKSGLRDIVAGKVHDEAAAQEHPDADRRDDQARRHRPDRGAARPERGHGSEARNQHDVERDVQHRHQDAEAQRRARVARRSQRAAQHEEEQHADAEDEHRAQKRQRLGLDRGRRVHQIEQRRRQHVAERRQDDEREDEGGQERLVDGAVDLVGLVRAGEARDEHAHAGEERGDEDDDDEEDLPAHADRRVAGEADVVADHRVIDDALQPADRVLQDRRPRHLPDRRRERAFDKGAIELAGGGRAGRRGGRLAGAPGVMSVIDPVAASAAADGADGGVVEADTSER